MFKLHRPKSVGADSLLSSKLYDQNTFYLALLKDLKNAKSQVIIESPFVTTRRVNNLMPIFRQLRKREVKIIINTKPLDEHVPKLYVQAQNAISQLQELGVLILFTVGHHRKIVIVDKQITWEGSLNVLSQNDSCEFMRRIYSEQIASQILSFLHLEKFIG
jgi:phosphatidylserine/phosphatidylglycerophosphate/cardiolipin synthase-like enzyme